MSEPIELRIVAELAERNKRRSLPATLISPIDFWEMAQRLSAKVELDSDALLRDGHHREFMTLGTLYGTTRVYSDPDCPREVFKLMPEQAPPR